MNKRTENKKVRLLNNIEIACSRGEWTKAIENAVEVRSIVGGETYRKIIDDIHAAKADCAQSRRG